MMKRFVEIALLTLALSVATSCHRPIPRASVPAVSPSLAAIDTMMWKQPDSAFRMLLDFAESPSVDSLDTYNGHYLQLLIAELLYKNDYQQTNRAELLRAVDYFDTLVARGGTPAQAFLDARAHYINGVGFYERDSVVKACQEYLHTLEIMETPPAPHIPRFMALTYNRLGDLFSGQFMMESAITCYKKALEYSLIEPSSPRSVSIILMSIGKEYDKLGDKEKASDYYERAIEQLADTNNLTYRDLVAIKALCNYQLGFGIKHFLSVFRQILPLANNERERMSRCLTIGYIFFEEGFLDSALIYLEPVMEFEANPVYQIQAANYLHVIYDSLGNEEKSQECLRYLVSHRESSGDNKALVSKLDGLFQDYIIQKKEEQAEIQRETASIRTVKIIVPISVVVVLAILVIAKRKSKKLLKEQQKEADRKLGAKEQEHEKELKLLKDQLVQQNNSSNPLGDGQALDAFKAEPICRLILERVEEGDFLSNIDCKMYKKYALDKAQLASLRDAADRNLNRFTFRIGSNYPKLTRGDMDYCCLYLLGLSDADVSALIQRAYSTVNERRNKLERILGSKTSLALTLQAIAIGKTIN